MRVFRSDPLFVRFFSIAQTTVWAWSACVCLTLAVGCAMMIAYGSGRPAANPASDLGLGICEGTACFRGLVPGKTGWENAASALSTMNEDPLPQGPAALSDNSQASMTGYISDQAFIFYASQDGQKLAAIFIRLRPGSLITLGDILTLYEMPTCVDTFYQQAGTLLLHYPDLHVSVRFRGTRFNPSTPVSSIVLGHVRDDATNPCNFQHIKGDDAVSQRPWAGFAFLGTHPVVQP